MDLEGLIAEVKKNSLSDAVNEFILGGVPACFTTNRGLITEIKHALSKHFKVHKKDLEIVGSAKLGFSLNRVKIGQEYNENSDIDIVIVSNELFDQAWHQLLMLDSVLYSLKQKDRESLDECYKNIPRGFISPDRLPKDLPFSKHWWQIFESLSQKPKYEYRKIRGRLFRNWWFVERYYSIQLAELTK